MGIRSLGGFRNVKDMPWLELRKPAAPVIEMASGDDAPPIEFAAMAGVKYLFLEQRAPAGAEENEVTLVFQGERQGMASWLADAGSGGAAEYLPAQALLAGYVSMREPSQLFQEFTALMTKQHESFQTDMAQVDEKLGPIKKEHIRAFRRGIARCGGSDAGALLTTTCS